MRLKQSCPKVADLDVAEAVARTDIRLVPRKVLTAWAVTVLVATAGLVSVADPESASARAAVSDCDPVAATEGEALAKAAQCNLPVAVNSSRSEYVQVVAQPDGRLTFESAVEPQRAKRPDGSWADVDLTLQVGSDNVVRPVAPAADVAFSNGGSGSFVTLRRAGKTLGLSWPGQLPTPVLSADSATYPEVLPDVDLVVQATRSGFTHVLVVKTAAAADNPGVRNITLGVTGDADLVRLPDGSLQAVSGTTLVGRAERPVMWDSSQPTSGPAAAGMGSEMSKSSSFAAGDGALTAAVETAVDANGNLLLTPDANLLDSPEVTYPVFIDPAWSVAKSKWAYATSNGCTNTDYSMARVGLSPEGPCSGVRYRSYFEFPTTNGTVSLKGKHIESAYVQMKLYHSWSCGNTWTHMYLTPVINATMKASWSTMALKTWLAAAEGHANKGTGCSDSPQDDMIMNFTGSTVTSQVRTAASGSWNTITVGFCACNSEGQYESSQDRWKKFYPGNAKLVVDYDSRPGKPTGLRVAGVACQTSAAIFVGTTSPTFSAVYPDADSGQSLVGTYEWIEVPSTGMGSVTDTYPARQTPPPNAWATANGRATTSAVSALNEKTYAYRVHARDPDPYYQWGPWSDWCQFTVDISVPDVQVSPVGAEHFPGKPITFVITSNDSTVTRFEYGWTGLTNSVTATGTSLKTATVSTTAPKYGQSIFHVAAIDSANNTGSGSTTVQVGSPTEYIARWYLETYPGQTDALADQKPVEGGNTPLTDTNVTWSDDVRLIDGKSATLDGSTSELTTSGPVVDTTKSFSVAAWLRIGELRTNNMTAVGQDGTDAGGFYLGTRWIGSPAKPYLSFMMKDTAASSSGSQYVYYPMELGSSHVGKWMHVAGVYDSTEGKIQIYVNGESPSGSSSQGSRTATPWAATGPFTVGRGFYNGSPTDRWFGEIADVHVFDRVLVAHDFTGQLKSEPESGGFDKPGFFAPLGVGKWTFDLGSPCYNQDWIDTCEAADESGFDRWMALRRGAEIGNGNRESGLHLDGYYFPDENTEPDGTTEWARTAYKAGTSTDSNGEQITVWQDSPVLRTDQSFTVSVWGSLEHRETMTNQSIVSQIGSYESAFWIKYQASTEQWEFILGSADSSSAVRSYVRWPAPADRAAWTHLVGVYDAVKNEMRLYVNGDLVGSTSLTWMPMLSSNALQVGRTLWHGNFTDHWWGGVDDLFVYQGAMNDKQVEALHESQVLQGSEF